MITQEMICNKSCQRDSGNCLSLFGAQLPEAMSRSCQQKVMNSLLFASKLWFKFAFWSKYLYFIQIQFSISQCISGEAHEVLTRKVMFLRLQRHSSGWIRSGYCERHHRKIPAPTRVGSKLNSHNTYKRQRLWHI